MVVIEHKKNKTHVFQKLDLQVYAILVIYAGVFVPKSVSKLGFLHSRGH